MEHFLINSSVCLFSLWLVYKLLLENTSWHQFKRYYFLATILISTVIPFIVVRTVVIPFNSGGTIDFTTMEATTSEVIETGFTLDWSTILLAIYGIGVFIMAARFIKNLYNLRIKTSDEMSSYENYQLVLRELIQIPHSFFSRIYASKTDYQSGAIPEAVLEHEKAHLDQRHSLDILFIELLIVLMWFNPLLYLIKYSIKLNHEFLADQAVLANGVDTKSYQETLLAYSSNSQHRALANTFNFPIIKKRFTIMKTHTTTASGLLRSLAIIPVLALLVISCGKEVTTVEPTIFHGFDDKKNPGVTYGIYIDGDLKNGSVRYRDQEFNYEIIEDDVVNLFTKEDEEIDLTKNRLEVTAVYDTEKAVNLLLEDESALKSRLANKELLVMDPLSKYTSDQLLGPALLSADKFPPTYLTFQDLKNGDYPKGYLVKTKRDGVDTYIIFETSKEMALNGY